MDTDPLTRTRHLVARARSLAVTDPAGAYACAGRACDAAAGLPLPALAAVVDVALAARRLAAGADTVEAFALLVVAGDAAERVLHA